MTKVTGLGDNFYFGGYDLSGDTNSLGKISGTVALIDTTAINQQAHARLGGLRSGGIDWVSYFNQAGAHVPLSLLTTADVIATYTQGTTLGNPAASITAKQINYDPTRGQAGDLTAAVSTQSNSYGLEWGLQLTPGNFNSTSALTGDSSTFEGGIANWVLKTNSTIAQTAAQAHGGTKSLAITSVAGGTMSAEHVTDAVNGAGGIPVVGGGSYAVSGWFRTAVSARTCNMLVSWYSSAGTFISTSSGSTITDSAAAWTQASSAHTAPATAAFAIVLGQVASTGGAAEVHYLDDVLFVTGSGSIDNGASTAFGLQAYLQVFSLTGTDATITIQDSPDNVTFTNVTNGGFTQITAAPTFQRIATANNATINRYLRAQVTTAAGYTALSYALQVSRNPIAGIVF